MPTEQDHAEVLADLIRGDVDELIGLLDELAGIDDDDDDGAVSLIAEAVVGRAQQIAGYADGYR